MSCLSAFFANSVTVQKGAMMFPQTKKSNGDDIERVGINAFSTHFIPSVTLSGFRHSSSVSKSSNSKISTLKSSFLVPLGDCPLPKALKLTPYFVTNS